MIANTAEFKFKKGKRNNIKVQSTEIVYFNDLINIFS